MTPPVGISRLTGGSWLELDLATSTPVTPPVRKLQVGVDVDGADASRPNTPPYNTLAGQIDWLVYTLGIDPATVRPIGNHQKFFDGGSGMAKAVDKYMQSGYDGLPILCHKVDNMGSYNNRLDQITKPEIWVYFHEWEKSVTGAQLSAGYLHMDQARRAHPNGHLIELLVDGASFQEEGPKKGAYKDVNFAAAHVEYSGLDIYVNWSEVPQKIFASTLAQHDWVKGTYPEYKGWCIPEFGMNRMVKPNTTDLAPPAERAASLQACFDYAEAMGCIFLNYWESDDSNKTGEHKDWRMSVDTVTRDVLTAAIDRRDLRS